MTTAPPVQEFQFGQRVRPSNGGESFVVGLVLLRDGWFYYGDGMNPGHVIHDVALVPERPPYVPTERRVVYRDGGPPTFSEFLNGNYRCETDFEMTERHVFEIAAYEASGATFESEKLLSSIRGLLSMRRKPSVLEGAMRGTP